MSASRGGSTGGSGCWRAGWARSSGGSWRRSDEALGRGCIGRQGRGLGGIGGNQGLRRHKGRNHLFRQRCSRLKIGDGQIQDIQGLDRDNGEVVL